LSTEGLKNNNHNNTNYDDTEAFIMQPCLLASHITNLLAESNILDPAFRSLRSYTQGHTFTAFKLLIV